MKRTTGAANAPNSSIISAKLASHERSTAHATIDIATTNTAERARGTMAETRVKAEAS